MGLSLLRPRVPGRCNSGCAWSSEEQCTRGNGPKSTSKKYATKKSATTTMKFSILVLALFATGVAVLFSADEKPAKKVELAHPFSWAAPDLLRADWQGEVAYVARGTRANGRTCSLPDKI